jgi:excisionase family DNA binding protein
MTTAIARLLSSAEVADLMQIPVRTLDQWAYLHRGPAFIRVGRYRRYRLTDVETWLNSQTTSRT